MIGRRDNDRLVTVDDLPVPALYQPLPPFHYFSCRFVCTPLYQCQHARHVCTPQEAERADEIKIFVELMTSDGKFKASSEGSK